MRERKCLLAKILKSNALTLTNYISHIIVPEKIYRISEEQNRSKHLSCRAFHLLFLTIPIPSWKELAPGKTIAFDIEKSLHSNKSTLSCTLHLAFEGFPTQN